MIELSKDKLFKLIQEMKEYRKISPKETARDMMKRYKMKTEFLLLDRILNEEGIDSLITKTTHEKKNLEMVKEIIKNES